MTKIIIRIHAILLLILFGTFSITKGQCCFNQTDKFENIWVVNHSEIICFNKKHTKIGTYSNIILGNPTYLDALDPFRIVVFYKNSQTIIVLNNTVSEISKPINLREQGIQDASLVCRSNNGGFWIFDRINWEILYFNSNFNATGEKIIPDMTFSNSNPVYLKEHNGILYLVFQGRGICRFDSFGARMSDIPIKIHSYFSIIDGSIIYLFDEKVFEYNLERNLVNEFCSPCGCVPVKVQGEFLYFNASGLSVCKM